MVAAVSAAVSPAAPAGTNSRARADLFAAHADDSDLLALQDEDALLSTASADDD